MGIALGRSNAVKVLGRALREALETVPFRLVSLDGGKSRNAIPRDAIAVCSVAADREQAFRDAIATAAANDPRRVREDGRRRVDRRRRRRRQRPTRGPMRAPPRCSMPSLSCRPGRSR